MQWSRWGDGREQKQKGGGSWASGVGREGDETDRRRGRSAASPSATRPASTTAPTAATAIRDRRRHGAATPAVPPRELCQPRRPATARDPRWAADVATAPATLTAPSSVEQGWGGGGVDSVSDSFIELGSIHLKGWIRSRKGPMHGRHVAKVEHVSAKLIKLWSRGLTATSHHVPAMLASAPRAAAAVGERRETVGKEIRGGKGGGMGLPRGVATRRCLPRGYPALQRRRGSRNGVIRGIRTHNTCAGPVTGCGVPH